MYFGAEKRNWVTIIFLPCALQDSNGSGQNQGLVLYIHSEVLMKSSKVTDKVLHLRQCRLGVEWTESSPVEMDLGMKHYMWAGNVHLQAKKPMESWAASKEVWPAGRGRWFIFFHSTLLKLQLEYSIQLWGSQY